MFGSLILGVSLSAGLACQQGNLTACYYECLAAEPLACVQMNQMIARGRRRGFDYELVCGPQRAQRCRIVARKRGAPLAKGPKAATPSGNARRSPQKVSRRSRSRRVQNDESWRREEEKRRWEAYWLDKQRDRRIYEGQGYE